MYYFYWNKTLSKTRIHNGECEDCNNGQGTKGTPVTENGAWSQGYNTYEDAKRAALAKGFKHNDDCSICNPNE